MKQSSSFVLTFAAASGITRCRKGLLFERLQEAGDSKVHAIHQEKQADYVNTLGRMRKLGAQEIATRRDLHPSLRVVQRQKQEEIVKREAGKEPTAFTPKAADSHIAGSPTSSFMTTRVCPRPCHASSPNSNLWQILSSGVS